MSEHKKLLHAPHYSPTTLYTRVDSLYNAVKQNAIKLKDVKEFIQKQESKQPFKRPKRIHSYFPIENHRWVCWSLTGPVVVEPGEAVVVVEEPGLVGRRGRRSEATSLFTDPQKPA